VISRKGFDATAVGCALPIFSNGDIFSVLILKKNNHHPDIENYDSITYLDVKF